MSMDTPQTKMRKEYQAIVDKWAGSNTYKDPALIKAVAECQSLADKLLQTHPCILEDGNFDHEWKFVDDSFDHEYGTQIEVYYECKCCKATKDYEGDDE